MNSSRIYLTRFVTDIALDIAGISADIATSGTGNASCAVYRTLPSGLPGKKLIERASFSTGLATPSANGAFKMSPGTYWLGIGADNGTVEFTKIDNDTLRTNSDAIGTNGTAYLRYSISYTTSAGMPDDLEDESPSYQVGDAPMVAMQLA